MNIPGGDSILYIKKTRIKLVCLWFLLSIFFLNSIIPVSAESISERLDRLENNELYKIGSIIYMTTSENPSIYFGGTWEETAKGRCIVGVEESDSSLSNSGMSGGEKAVRLLSNQLPSHNHSATTSTAGLHSHSTSLYPNSQEGGNPSTFGFRGSNWNGSGGYFYNRILVNTDWNYADTTTNSEFVHSHSFTTNSSGESQTHNNMQPYYVVHIWERVA